ncbi:LacI family transcriptional regulator, partial [mine drainage metagenome]
GASRAKFAAHGPIGAKLNVFLAVSVRVYSGSTRCKEDRLGADRERQMATIKDVAAKVGVSVATVSNALNDKPNVGSTVRRKVLRAATELGYRPHRAAQAMRKGRTRAIGLVLPDLTNPFFPQLAQTVENKARKLGLLVCLIDSQDSAEGEADGLTLLAQHGVDGIIWC